MTFFPERRDAGEVFAEAVALQEAGRYAPAIAALKRFLALEPQHADAHSRQGWLLWRTGQLDESLAAHQRATQLAPNQAAVWSNYGVALQAKGRHDEALEVLRHAVRLDPDLADAQVNLGLDYYGRGMGEDAIACFRRAVTVDGRLADAWVNLGLVLQEAGEIAAPIAVNDHALGLRPGHRAAMSNGLMTRQYAASLSATDLAASARRNAAALGGSLPLPARDRWRRGARRLRVGYVSGDLYGHPVGYFALRALLAHDGDLVEAHAYSDTAVEDAMTTELKTAFAHWHDTRGLDDEALRERILEAGIDVLVDLAGHTAGNRLGVFAKRAAPVQLAWLGYAASTGLSTIDGAILGPAMAPPGAEAAFVEPVIRLPRLQFTYRPPAYAPPVALCPQDRKGLVTFGCFNNPAKIGVDVIQAWARAMGRVEGSRLVLKWRAFHDPNAVARLHRRFQMLGIDPSRIEARPLSSHAEMLAQYADVDIALDPFPFCGGLTTCEALWMGVPVVTLPWVRPMSRQGAAILEAVALDDLVATTPRDYVDRIVGLAQDLPRRKALRDSLRARLEASPLFDGESLARALEAEYVRFAEAAA